MINGPPAPSFSGLEAQIIECVVGMRCNSLCYRGFFSPEGGGRLREGGRGEIKEGGRGRRGGGVDDLGCVPIKFTLPPQKKKALKYSRDTA